MHAYLNTYARYGDKRTSTCRRGDLLNSATRGCVNLHEIDPASFLAEHSDHNSSVEEQNVNVIEESEAEYAENDAADILAVEYEAASNPALLP